MAIGSIEAPTSETAVDTQQEHIATSTVLDMDIPINDLTKYIEGSSWSVTYYNNQLAKDDIASVPDVVSSVVVEQYVKYNGLEIKVTQAIETASFTDVTGSAVISDIRPNEGDVFVATLLDNTKCLFRIINVDRNLYNFRPIYTIEYKLSAIYTSTTRDTFNNLEEKVVREFFYDTKASFTNSTPIVTSDTLRFRRDAIENLKVLTRNYFNTFFDKDLGILRVPIDDTVVIDPVLEAFIYKVFDYDDITMLTRLSRFDADNIDILYDTVYDALIKQRTLSEFTKRNMVLKDVRDYTNSIYLRSMCYYGFDFVVEHTTSSDTEEITMPDSETITTMNILMDRHINKEVYDQETIGKLLTEYRRWTPLEQYYYMPILYLLTKQAAKYSYTVGVK
jgi:hypothetical protein